VARGDDQIRNWGGDGRGRDADRPSEIPAAGWRDILIRTWRESSADNVGLIAAGVAFYGFLALVPLLGALVLSYGLFADPETVVRHIRTLFDLLPREAAALLADQLVAISGQSAKKTGLGLAVALALSLYGAMRGASAIIAAFNIAYEEQETRGLVRTTFLALAVTLVAVATGLMGVVAVGALGYLEHLLPNAPDAMLLVLRILFWAAAAVAASVAVAALFRFGPSRDEAKWRWLTPGTIFATVGWIVISLGFGFYTANFANYNATYGALGAVVVLLMWLYLSAYVLIVGAELNSEIEHQTAVDTTEGPEQPMGTRRAHMADTIGEVPAGPGNETGEKAGTSAPPAAARAGSDASLPLGSSQRGSRARNSGGTSGMAHRWRDIMLGAGVVYLTDRVRKRWRRRTRRRGRLHSRQPLGEMPR
jgi:membrane protein